MKKIISIILLGLLSMLFAEVFSGSSQLWFIDFEGIIITFMLYLVHIVFLLFVALRARKVSLVQLYFFGVLFGLYEGIITKVLWAGYMGSDGPGFGTILGVAAMETPILIFFWHPLFAFIIPILVYQILSKEVLIEHDSILVKTKKKSFLIVLLLIASATYIANGNQFDLVSANGAVLGTIGLVIFFHLINKKGLKVAEFKDIRIWPIVIGLITINVGGAILLFPENLPNEVIPYLVIGAFYVISIIAIIVSRGKDIEVIKLNKKHYNNVELLWGAVLLIVFVNAASLFPGVSNSILFTSYLMYALIGIILLGYCLLKIRANKKIKRGVKNDD